MKWPFAHRPGGALPQAAAWLAIALLAGCGGADAPNDPSSPSPSAPPSASPQAGGTISGNYILEIRPAPTCGMGGPLTFPMAAAAAGTSPYPGVQVLLAGAEAFELELLTSATAVVSGGFGTTENGALSAEAVRIWMHAIGSGPITRAADGRGQVASGRLSGFIAFGHASGPEGSLGSCDSVDHSYALRVR